MPTLIRRSRRKGHSTLMVLSLLVILCLAWGNKLSPLLTGHFVAVHSLLELIPLAAHFAIFTVGLLTFRHTENFPTLFISMTALAVGVIDLGHILSFPEMPGFFLANSADTAIYYSLVGRITEATCFLLVATSFRRDFNLRLSAQAGLLMAVGWGLGWHLLILFLEHLLPGMFSLSAGLSSFKISLTVMSILIWIFAGISFYLVSLGDSSPGRLWLAIASFISALSGLFFISYASLSEFNILMGHLYKAIGVCYIYRSMLYDCITSPVVELKKHVLKEAHQSESKSRFIASIGHELRTPLGVISGYSDILLMNKNLDDEARDWVGTIKKSSDQIRLIINDLLDLSKAESNSLTINKKTFNLTNFFDELTSEIEILAHQKGIKLEVELAPELHINFESDRLRLKQVIVNLLSNAIKFTDHGLVKVSCSKRESDQGSLYISVTDTGIGIAEDQRHLLFKTYSQIENELVSSQEGTGLGLALSKKLTELLGGELYLEWSEVGAGSTFTIRMPIDPNTTQEMIVNTSKLTQIPKFGGVHILIVDDAKENLFIAEQYLTETEAIVTLVEDPCQAVDFVAQHLDSLDVIFLDIMMPVMNGYEVCEKVRSLGFRGPIVALSAHSEINMTGSENRFYFDAHLMKPIDKESLWSSVHQAVLNYH